MKISRTVGILLTLVLAFAVMLAVTACVDDNKKDDPTKIPDEEKVITGVSFDDLTVTYDGDEKEITVKGALPTGVSVSYENNKGTDAGVYTATATLSGEGYKTVKLTAKLTIEKATIDTVVFDDLTVTYDGTEYALNYSGTLPEGAEVSIDGEPATDAGIYDFTLTVTHKNYKDYVKTAKLTINKADITTVNFSDKTVTYDGEEHEILYTGEIPEGAHVTYSSNKATNAGTYTATVTVSHKNYNTYTANAVLTVKKATITGVSLESATFTYDGEEKSLSFIGTLPEGVTPVWSGNAATEVGNHPVALRISGENYEALELSAFIIIEAAPIVPDKVIEGVSLENGNFVYDGTEKSIEVTGDVPEGVSVSYAGNGKVNAGEYSVTAVLTGDGYETLTLTAKIIIAKAKITGVTLEDASFTYDANAQHSIKIVGTIPDGTSIEYTGNKQTNAGTYKVTAVITGENYETLILEATMTIVNSSGGGIVTPPMPF